MAEAHTLEADDRLLPLLDEMERSGEVVITRNGRAVAKLVPAVPSERAKALMEQARVLREGMAARGERFSWDELKAWRDEGRP